MPTSVLGRVSFVSLLFYVITFIMLLAGIYRGAALGAITLLIKIGIVGGVPIAIISIFALRTESSYNKVIPAISMVISVFLLVGACYFMFFWSFGG